MPQVNVQGPISQRELDVLQAAVDAVSPYMDLRGVNVVPTWELDNRKQVGGNPNAMAEAELDKREFDVGVEYGRIVRPADPPMTTPIPWADWIRPSIGYLVEDPYNEQQLLQKAVELKQPGPAEYWEICVQTYRVAMDDWMKQSVADMVAHECSHLHLQTTSENSAEMQEQTNQFRNLIVPALRRV